MIHWYDFEVLPKTWLVCIYTAGEGWTTIVNDREALHAFWEKSAGSVWVSFNGRGYDRWIFKSILAGFDPYEVSQFIIEGGNKGWQFHKDLVKWPLNDYDVKAAIDRSLKFMEGSLGVKIVESSVPFDLPREPTEAELQELIEYCQYDVMQLMTVFAERQDAFKAHLGLVNWAGLDIKNVSKTPTQLVSTILRAQKVRPKIIWTEFDITLPDNLKLGKYQHIADWYLSSENHRYKSKDGTKHQLTTTVAAVEHILGWGGLHGAREQYSYEGLLLNCDVSSMYPNIIRHYNLMSRGVPDPQKYNEIIDQRMEYKALGDPRSDSLKLASNSLYGSFKDSYNNAYDPRQSNLVCVYGQLLLIDLIEKLESVPGLEIIQSNTDGVLMKLARAEDYYLVDDIAAEWEERTHLSLDFEEYAKVAQKDVNNYVIVAHDGSFKSKGAYVKKQNPLDFDLAIVNKAVVARLVHNTPVSTTVNAATDLRDFQLIASAGSKYKGLWYGQELLREKTVRAFASTRSSDPGLKKEHKNGTMTKIPSSPDNIFMVNDDIRGVSRESYQVDVSWYVQLAEERLRAFGVEENYG